jgi:lipopolysaccharide/colanic/teichoic acid biosynthesis glycosyltransferase
MAYETLVPYYALRQVMPPGVSGWAQVNGLRGPTEDAALATARIDHDLAYIQNHSFWLDIRIIWLTVREIFGGTGV